MKSILSEKQYKKCKLNFISFSRNHLNPQRTLILGYFFFIILGSFLLFLPISAVGKSTTFIDAFFTATSSICVTGLIVTDTAVHWSFFGKTVILLLIQIGGLGYMTIASFIIIFLGGKVGIYSRRVMNADIGKSTISGLGRFTKKIIKITLLIELIGAIIISIIFIPKFGVISGIGHSVFHSISAFCNAGFSTFSDNLSSFFSEPLVLYTISILFILGGLGFVVLLDIGNFSLYKFKKLFKFKTPRHSLMPYSRLVLFYYFILTLVPFLILWLIDYNIIENYSFFNKISNVFFQVTTPRTAGFNSLDFSIFSPASLLIILILMFIGAASGGTGGGIKISTLAVAISTIISTFKTRDKTILFKRKLDSKTIRKSFSLILISIFWIVFAFVFIILLSPYNFISKKLFKLIFEIVSAFGTVGLSLGSSSTTNSSFSADLNNYGKLFIILTMLIGRVGPLTFGFAIIKIRKVKKIDFVKGFFPVG